MTMTLIETKTLGTAAASIEFTSIPQTFTDLIIVASIRRDSSSGSGALMMRLNGDTGTNYSWRTLFGTGSSTGSVNDGAATSALIGEIGNSTDTANTFSSTNITIPNYTVVVAKSASGDSVTENNATTAFQVLAAGRYSQTTAITSLSLFNSGGANLSIDSTVSLYGVLKGSDGITTAS
jgi:hypothetical protein